MNWNQHRDRADSQRERATVETCRANRQQPTKAEDALWQVLRRKRCFGLKFRRQHPIRGFVVDFYCAPLRLVIEVDGDVHDDVDRAQQDAERQRLLEAEGRRVMRFSNEEVLHHLDDVMQCLKEACGADDPMNNLDPHLEVIARAPAQCIGEPGRGSRRRC